MDNIITIDGPTGSGKSTVSRALADRLNYRYLDTGAMYRAFAVAVLNANINLHDTDKIEKIGNTIDIKLIREGESTKVLLNGEDVTKEIRRPFIDLFASRVSGLNVVRQAMTRLQKKEGAHGELVAEGRDMGTVVFPEAKHKFYLDASVELRVKRRFLERQKRGEPVSIDKVKEDLIKRDNQDINRALSPLKPAKDAIIIDTTLLNVEQIVQMMIKEVKRAHKR